MCVCVDAVRSWYVRKSPPPSESAVLSYLGSEVDQSGKVKKEIAVRLEQAGRVYQM